MGLVLKGLVTLRTLGVPLLLMNNPDVTGETVHSHQLFALWASQFVFLMNTLHVFLQVKIACEFCLAVFLRTGKGQILLMNKPLVLLHVRHRHTTLPASLCPLLNRSVDPLMLFQGERCEELFVTVVTLQGFLFAVLDPKMPFHVKRLLSTNLTLGTRFVLVLQLYMPVHQSD